jgi:hypothetical protein
MAHDILPSNQSIDLINVAFENPRVVQAAKRAVNTKKANGIVTLLEQTNEDLLLDSAYAYENCPDRVTGRKAFQELQEVCPDRLWRLVIVS